ncbi:cyclopropane-fatty-acyl-phospholipid synthase [Limimonas halophila]|uniref:Cyclopropane-fatty-acyl-phospholipid synthase n=1 Tax=Limimonas halophila TaxID=1082479 RepID=A0A1G7LGK0_9PROT|nr:cyclopropane-fatty-acyl-phospholipid synthase family protein [Limimonas halophila]SDF48692.1 cyclopropane-fatty-acyl-phospholipid synthase [Limimonas halophila]
MVLVRLLRSLVHTGSLAIVDATGRRTLVGDGSPPEATVRVRGWTSELAIAANPALKLGEAYMDGRLVVEAGSIYDVLDVVARNLGTVRNGPIMAALEGLGDRLGKAGRLKRARRQVAHHYDLSARLYDLFLDDDRQYSCAYYRAPDEDLDTAQHNKKRHIAAKLNLDRPGLRVLDIGSGWGGLGVYLAETFGAHVTGVTLSTEQLSYSQARAAASPAADRLDFQLRDYREVEGPFDRIVSVGMFEHIGKRNYDSFFAKVRDLLTDDGVALIHAIGFADAPGPINPFMRKYIFPGAELPSLSEVFAAVERIRLWATDAEVLRLHYAMTLRAWRERFMANAADAAALYDERFVRMWEFYLALCEIGFRRRTNMVWQLQLTRRVDTLPITRDYIVDTERRLMAAERDAAQQQPHHAA